MADIKKETKKIRELVCNYETWIKEQRGKYFKQGRENIHNKIWIEKMRLKYFGDH